MRGCNQRDYGNDDLLLGVAGFLLASGVLHIGLPALTDRWMSSIPVARALGCCGQSHEHSEVMAIDGPGASRRAGPQVLYLQDFTSKANGMRTLRGLFGKWPENEP
jgi:hypothetical protein